MGIWAIKGGGGVTAPSCQKKEHSAEERTEGKTRGDQALKPGIWQNSGIYAGEVTGYDGGSGKKSKVREKDPGAFSCPNRDRGHAHGLNAIGVSRRKTILDITKKKKTTTPPPNH